MKRYATLLKATAIIQIIAALIHLPSLFIWLPPKNDTEKQLFTLLDTYKFDMGLGFHRTLGEMTLVFSASLCLLGLLAGLINWHLFRKNVDVQTMKGVININLLLFGILFILTMVFAFWLPIFVTGLIVLFLGLTRSAMTKKL